MFGAATHHSFGDSPLALIPIRRTNGQLTFRVCWEFTPCGAKLIDYLFQGIAGIRSDEPLSRRPRPQDNRADDRESNALSFRTSAVSIS